MQQKTFFKRLGACLLISAIPVTVYMLLQFVFGIIGSFAGTLTKLLGENSLYNDFSFDIFEILSDPTVSNIIIVSVGVSAVFAIGIFAFSGKGNEYSLRSLFAGRIYISEVIIALITGVVLNIAVLAALSLTGLDSLAEDSGLDGMLRSIHPAVLFISVGLLGPAVEEILFRGFVYKTARNNFNRIFAILLSSAGFALIHGNLFQMTYAFPVGIVLGLALMFSGKLIVPVIMHVSYNCFNILLSLTVSDMTLPPAPEESSAAASWVFLSMLLLVLTLLMMLLAYIGRRTEAVKNDGFANDRT